MIIDSINNLSKYEALNPRFSKVLEFINSHDLAQQPEGKQVIDGSDLFVNFSLAKGKTPAEAKLESHNEMIDIQIPLSCTEVMGYTPREDLDEQPYNAEKDITFYEGMAQQYVAVKPGMFAIFFPQDGHAPCIADDDVIKKVIFKVKC